MYISREIPKSLIDKYFSSIKLHKLYAQSSSFALTIAGKKEHLNNPVANLYCKTIKFPLMFIKSLIVFK